MEILIGLVVLVILGFIAAGWGGLALFLHDEKRGKTAAGDGQSSRTT